jgi:hypothetical protein
VVNDGFSCTYLEGIITVEVYCRGNLTKGRKLRAGEEVKNSQRRHPINPTFSTSTNLLALVLSELPASNAIEFLEACDAQPIYAVFTVSSSTGQWKASDKRWNISHQCDRILNAAGF